MFDMNQMGQMMGKAQEFQQKLKTDLVKMAIRGTSGGGAVTVVINGLKEVTKIDIDPGATSDAEMLSDMLLAALNSAYSEADKKLGDQMSGLFGGLDLQSLGQLFKT